MHAFIDTAPKMVERVFLGWSEPFVGLAASWLLDQKDELTGALVVVPTGQSKRQLRFSMAEASGAVLTPQITTPGALMRKEGADIAPDWMEKHAWQEVLEQSGSQTLLQDLFPESIGLQGAWAGGLAGELFSLRRSLQENGLMLTDVARRLGATPEKDRWLALEKIEGKVEAWLRKQGLQSRSDALRRGIILPAGIHRIILAGITELPALVERTFLNSDLPCTCLIPAPETHSEAFSEIGIPLDAWREQHLPWPESSGTVDVSNDPAQQAHRARALAAGNNTSTEDFALGSCDSECGDLLAREFTKAGWPTHHPAASAAPHGLRRWLMTWTRWLQQPDLSTLADLLSLPQTAKLIEADCGVIAHALARVRNSWMVISPDDLRHQLKHGNHERLKSEAVDAIRACEKLERWRKLCEADDLASAIRHLVDALGFEDDQTTAILDGFTAAAERMKQSKRSMSYWIELILADIPQPGIRPPADRQLDVHGWLELLFQPGSHLMICGLNEGRIPSMKSDDPWLGESARSLLGLSTDGSRASRDAFLLQSLIESRLQSKGRVDLLCSRNNQKGEPMLPSRLLLAAEPEEIAKRVRLLFRELEPADAKLRWQVEDLARWKLPEKPPLERISATSFRDHLACPLRHHLKHVQGMRDSEPDRIEWNARDFGNVIHDVLEAWGKNEEARRMTDAADIHHWLSQRLDHVVQNTFDHRIPLAVRIQLDAMRHRLEWFSQTQAELIADGWQVTEIEHEFRIPLGDHVISAKIDRIDYHPETGELRIIDYKTGGKDKTTASAHRTSQRANSTPPAHIAEDDPAFYERQGSKGSTRYLWKDLQLPLYALAILERDQKIAIPCHFKLGETRKDVELRPWSDFDEVDIAAAKACALWAIDRITSGQLSPAADKVTYDDYEQLWATHLPVDVLAPADA